MRGSRTAVPFIAAVSAVTLTDLRQLLEMGTVTPVIDRPYPLGSVAEALRYFGQGHARGKVVITM